MILLIKITVNDLLDICGGKLINGNKNEKINECFVNSKENCFNGCFFGIKGKKVDGSLFYKEAFNNGARVCVLNKIKNIDLKGYEDRTIIIVDDTINALQDLAKYKRSLFKGKVIAITGSVGKTSTKEIVSRVLTTNYKVLKTRENQNSQVGLPITILRLKDENVMVLEMGMNNFGQLHNLSLIAKPDISIITNVYDSHIGNLGTRKNILKAKLEILDGMDEGILIINNDNYLLKEIDENIKENIKIMSVGIKNKSNIMAKNIVNNEVTTFDIDDLKSLKVVGGNSFIYNALFAYLIGKLFGVSRGMIKKGINDTSTLNHRLELINLNNNIILIDDCYNASFDSVKAALEYIKIFKKRKIVILGDILELGNESKNIHTKIGKLVVSNDIEHLITIGKFSKFIDKEAIRLGMKKNKIKHFDNETESREYIKNIIKENDVILLKGSNGMNLINLVNYLKEGLV